MATGTGNQVERSPIERGDRWRPIGLSIPGFRRRHHRRRPARPRTTHLRIARPRGSTAAPLHRQSLIRRQRTGPSSFPIRARRWSSGVYQVAASVAQGPETGGSTHVAHANDVPPTARFGGPEADDFDRDFSMAGDGEADDDDDFYAGRPFALDSGNDSTGGSDGSDVDRGDDGAAFGSSRAGLFGLVGGLGGDGGVLLSGTALGDVLTGGGGGDTLLGMAGDDVLNGGDGGDTLLGGDGDDVLSGEGGNDVLDGGAGNDSLIGGPGDDSMAGGDGDDTYIFGGATGDQ